MIQIHFLGYENKLGAWIDLIQYAINLFWTVGKFYQQIRVNGSTLLQNGQRWETFKKNIQEHIFVLIKGLDHQKEYSKSITRAISNEHVVNGHHKTCSFHPSWQVEYFQNICLMGILILINLKCFDKGLFTSVPFNFGEWHLVMHFVFNVHYMPAYVAHENITLWILYSGNRMQVRFPQATTVTIKQNFKKQACTKKHTTRPSILLNCRKTMVPMGKHFLIDNRQKTNF